MLLGLASDLIPERHNYLVAKMVVIVTNYKLGYKYNLRTFQQTPGAYPKPVTNSVWFGIPESFGGLGMSGVCSEGILGFP